MPKEPGATTYTRRPIQKPESEVRLEELAQAKKHQELLEADQVFVPPILNLLHDPVDLPRTESNFVKDRLAGEPRAGAATNTHNESIIPHYGTLGAPATITDLVDFADEFALPSDQGQGKTNTTSYASSTSTSTNTTNKKANPSTGLNSLLNGGGFGSDFGSNGGNDFLSGSSGFGANNGVILGHSKPKLSSLNSSVLSDDKTTGTGFGSNAAGGLSLGSNGANGYAKQARYQPNTSVQSQPLAPLMSASAGISTTSTTQANNEYQPSTNRFGRLAQFGMGMMGSGSTTNSSSVPVASNKTPSNSDAQKQGGFALAGFGRHRF